MKAFLLAAGLGTRLLQLTEKTPKCLVSLGGRPLLDYWFDLFRKHGITEVFINTSHHAKQVEEHVRLKRGMPNVTLGYEEMLLGSGGTIRKNRWFVEGEESFFILYADHLTNIDLSRMLRRHREAKTDFTLALYPTERPRECGIVELDEKGVLRSFVEKPEAPLSNLAFAGAMVCSPSLFDHFPDEEVFDLGFHLLPKLKGLASGYLMDEYHLDIGTVERFQQAQRDIADGTFRF